MKTKAAILRHLKAPLEIHEISIPLLKRGQALVKIAYSGLCHTQLNEIKGLKGEDKFLPHTLGHEGSGTVVEVGEDVTKVKVDDHVVLSWIKGKGHDVPNSIYEYQKEKINSGAISTFLEYAVISENRLNSIPKQMPLREAALLGCALPTGGGVIFNEMQLKEGSSIALFGCGGIGLSAIIAAAYSKASPIIAIDINIQKLELAKKFGATHTLNAIHDSVKEKILELSQGKGVDYSLECAGRKEVMEMAFQVIKPGGKCVLAGNLPKGQQISIDPFDLILGKKLYGTWGGGSQIDRDIAIYTNLFLKNNFPFQDLITHEYPLEKINELINELDQGRVGRGIIGFK